MIATVPKKACFLHLCLPVYRGYTKVNLTRDLIGLALDIRGEEQEKHFRGMRIHTSDICSVPEMRNEFWQNAIEDKADWMLMIDSDNYVDSESVIENGRAYLEMIKEGERRNAAVIAMSVPIRNSEKHSLNFIAKEGKEWNFGEVFEVHKVGTGIMAINVEFLRDNDPKTMPWFEEQFKREPDKKNRWVRVGSDFVFCDRVRAAGGLILCDSRNPTRHDN